MSERKECSICGETKALQEFYRRPNLSIEPVCRKCRTAEERKNANSSPRSYLRTIVNKARYGAKKRQLVFDINIDDVMEIYTRQKGKCALSGIRMTYNRDGRGRRDMNISLDRIAPDRGYTRKPANVQLVCLRVNLMKHTLEEHEFLWWIGNILENHDL